MTGWSRSDLESSVFMELHPCACGSAEFTDGTAERQVREGDGVWFSEYTGTCAGCGTGRRFTFTVSEEIPQLAPGAWSALTEPSQLIDAGEWLAVAESYGAEGETEANIRLAAGAIDEVLLSVPAGADAVPVDAFRSELGRQMYAADPTRFRKDELEHARDVYASRAGDIQPGWDAWPLRARTINEASLFTELHRCACGMLQFDRTARWTPGEERAVLTYEGECTGCGRGRYFEFSVPADADSVPGPDPLETGYGFPGDGPSELLDPAQFWLFGAESARAADLLAADAPGHVWRDGENWDAMTELLATSVAAFQEVLAFVPPGADRVPGAAFRTPSGRVLLRQDPGIFLRDRLVAAHAERDRLLHAFIAEHPAPDDDEEE
jgi:Fe-S cluster biogenesis protein NfuA